MRLAKKVEKSHPRGFSHLVRGAPWGASPPFAPDAKVFLWPWDVSVPDANAPQGVAPPISTGYERLPGPPGTPFAPGAKVVLERKEAVRTGRERSPGISSPSRTGFEGDPRILPRPSYRVRSSAQRPLQSFFNFFGQTHKQIGHDFV